MSKRRDEVGCYCGCVPAVIGYSATIHCPFRYSRSSENPLTSMSLITCILSIVVYNWSRRKAVWTVCWIAECSSVTFKNNCLLFDYAIGVWGFQLLSPGETYRFNLFVHKLIYPTDDWCSQAVAHNVHSSQPSHSRNIVNALPWTCNDYLSRKGVRIFHQGLHMY